MAWERLAEWVFDVRGNGALLGEESGLLVADGVTRRVVATNRVTAGASGPTRTTYEFDASGIRAAVRVELSGSGMTVGYERHGDTVVAHARRADGELEVQRIVSPGAVLTGADVASDFVFARLVPASARDSIIVDVVRFGEESWRLAPGRVTLRRDSTDSRAFIIRQNTPWGPMTSRVVIDDLGMVTRAEAVIAMGSMRVTATRRRQGETPLLDDPRPALQLRPDP